MTSAQSSYRQTMKNKKIDLGECDYIENGYRCHGEACWLIKQKDRNNLRVCDIHLAWAIRLSGFPAMIDNAREDEEGMIE